ncbi:hypothetical protein [Shewanella frigidimarina]|uniref:hypothetical protein n=1 Tax=Shewanella frigidimarina TaxID=56812 RepID=UPI003D7AAE4F
MSSLVNKGMKIWLAVIAAVVVYAVIVSAFDSTPQPVRDAKSALYLEYRNIYQQSVCDSLELENTWYILCHPSELAAGGLFEVHFSDIDSHSYELSAANGKGQQHAEIFKDLQVILNKTSIIHPSDVMMVFKTEIEG